MNAYSATLPTFKERLALLYVLNDVYFHASNTYGETKRFIPSASSQFLTSLFSSVKSAPNAQPKQMDRLLRLWAEKQYFSSEVFATIAGVNMPVASVPEERPQIHKPAILGCVGDPYYLLPVSCMIEVIVLPH
jgi:hypothetical protein